MELWDASTLLSMGKTCGKALQDHKASIIPVRLEEYQLSHYSSNQPHHPAQNTKHKAVIFARDNRLPMREAQALHQERKIDQDGASWLFCQGLLQDQKSLPELLPKTADARSRAEAAAGPSPFSAEKGSAAAAGLQQEENVPQV